MKRLKSTRDIFNNKNATVIALVAKVDRQTLNDYHRFNRLKGDLLRATRPRTIAKLSDMISQAAQEMALHPTNTVDKTKLLRLIVRYKRQNQFLKVAAINQAVIALCANYEDFVHRVIVKYYEEDVSRLTRNKQAVTSRFIIDALKRGDNIHHSMAEQVANDVMQGGIVSWHKYLKSIGMDTNNVPHSVHEVFLIRHCLIHNNVRVSSQLHAKNSSKYQIRRSIRLTVEDVEYFKNELYVSMKFISDEYNRLFPKSGGTWLRPNDDNIDEVFTN